MSKNKKPKKKYTPRTVYFPKIINSMFAFKPLEEALEKLLIHGEILQDNFGFYVYRNNVNEEESFIAGLEIYSELSKRLYEYFKYEPLDITSLLNLRDEMEAQEGFYEGTIEEALITLEKCKSIIAKAPTLVVRELTLQIGLERKEKVIK